MVGNQDSRISITTIDHSTDGYDCADLRVYFLYQNHVLLLFGPLSLVKKR